MCTNPPRISNGYISYDTPGAWANGDVIEYLCFTGYAPVDSTSLTCSAGLWTGTTPECKYHVITEFLFWFLLLLFILLLIAVIALLIFLCCYFCRCCKGCCKRKGRRIADQDDEESQYGDDRKDTRRRDKDGKTKRSPRRSKSPRQRRRREKAEEEEKSEGSQGGCCGCCKSKKKDDESVKERNRKRRGSKDEDYRDKKKSKKANDKPLYLVNYYENDGRDTNRTVLTLDRSTSYHEFDKFSSRNFPTKTPSDYDVLKQEKKKYVRQKLQHRESRFQEEQKKVKPADFWRPSVNPVRFNNTSTY